jgi:hypothetical protein
VKVIATIFRRSTCCAEVALVLSQAGKLYPVEIGEEGISTTRGEKSASVDTTDFHRCAWYPGLAEFIQHPIQRGARRLRMRLLTARERIVLLSWTHGKWQDLVLSAMDARARFQRSAERSTLTMAAASERAMTKCQAMFSTCSMQLMTTRRRPQQRTGAQPTNVVFVAAPWMTRGASRLVGVRPARGASGCRGVTRARTRGNARGERAKP